MRLHVCAVAFITILPSLSRALSANTIEFERWRNAASIMGPYAIAKL